jgi:sortase A
MVKRSLFAIGTAGIIFSLIIISFLIFDLPGQVFYAPPSLSSNVVNSGLPMRLKIPAINVDTAIEYLGLTSDGAMAVPEGPTDVAWFDLGPRPGESGSAVIAGHEGWKDGIAAAFDDLHKLQKGDKVYVEDETGAVTAFIVRAVGTYDENGNAAAVFSSDDGKAHLNLITCEGIWNAATKSYSDRLVVFTDEL